MKVLDVLSVCVVLVHLSLRETTGVNGGAIGSPRGFNMMSQWAPPIRRKPKISYLSTLFQRMACNLCKTMTEKNLTMCELYCFSSVPGEYRPLTSLQKLSPFAKSNTRYSPDLTVPIENSPILHPAGGKNQFVSSLSNLQPLSNSSVFGFVNPILAHKAR